MKIHSRDTPNDPGASRWIQHATSRSSELLEAGAAWLGLPPPRPEVRFDLRGRAAGQARFGPRGTLLIRYNRQLLLANPEPFIDETVPHECAHVLAYARYGRRIRPHGPEWQAIVTRLGGKPERCHAFDVSSAETRRMREFDYHCGCGSHRLSAIRHHRVLAGQVYLCRRCAQPLKAGPAG